MSDIHVLTSDGHGRVTVVMHFAVTNTNNSVPGGVNWRDALIGSGIGGTTQLADAADDGNPKGWEITAAEKALIAAGSVYEHRANFPLESAGTQPAQHQVALRSLYARRKPEVIATLQRQLKYTGHTESRV